MTVRSITARVDRGLRLAALVASPFAIHAAPVGIPESLLPADTVLAIHVRDVGTLGERLAASPIGRHYDSPDGKVLRDTVEQFLDEPFYFSELELTNREVIALVPGSWVVAFRLPAPTDDELAGTEPDSGGIPFLASVAQDRLEMVLLGELEDPKPVLDVIREADTRIVRDNPDRRVEEQEHGGFTVFTDSLVAEDGTATVGSAYAVTDRWQIFADDPATVRGIIDAIAGIDAGPRLDDALGWRVVADRASDAEFTMFVNLEHLGKVLDRAIRATTLPPQMGGMGTTRERMADTLRLDVLGGLHASMSLDDDRAVIKGSLEASEWTGFLRLLKLDALAGLPREAPPGVTSANALALDMGHLVRELRAMLSEIAPVAGAMLEAQIANAKEQANLDIDGGLLSNLSTYRLQVLDIAVPPRRDDGTIDQEAIAKSNRQVVQISLRDGAALLNLIETIKLAQPGFASVVAQREIGGAQVFDLVPQGEGVPDPEISIAVRGDVLFFSNGSRALLDRVLTQREGDGDLWSEAEFATLLREVPGDAVGVTATRIGPLADLIEVAIGAGLEAMGDSETEAQVGPFVKALAEAIRPMIGVGWTRIEGNLVWQESTFTEANP